MKRPDFIITGMCIVVLSNCIIIPTIAQEGEPDSKFSVGADIYTNYIWRGTKYGTGPCIQPAVQFESGGFTIGVWGSFDALGYTEADPYVSYSFPFGLNIGFTDYYYPALEVFDFTENTGSHAFELNSGYSNNGFSLSANYIINEAGGAESSGGDMYFQAGYDFKNISLFMGGGNGWHTSDGDFKVCNVGIGTSKVIRVTDKFSIPVTGQIILNPEREKLYVVAGFSF
jgi:hypothetical protein